MTDNATRGLPRPIAQDGMVTLANGQTRRLAGLWSRLLARLLDIIITGVVVAILFAVGFLGEAGDETFWRAFFINENGGLTWRALLIGLLYEVVLIAFLGRTIGKMIMGIKVVKARNGGIPLPLKAFIRYAVIAGIWGILGRISEPVAAITGLANLLVFLSPVFKKTRQGWHDILATTVVIKSRSG